MITLGIETSGPLGGVALVDGGRVFERRFEATRALGHELAPAIQSVLDEAGLGPESPPDLVAVDVGPGSYTGLRVGLAAGKGLAFAWGRPLVGVRLVDLLARQAPSPARRIACALDAQRGEVWSCVLERAGTASRVLVEPRISLPAELAQALGDDRDLWLIGDAAATVGKAREGLRVAPEELWWPTPRLVATLGRELHVAGARDDAIALSPVYLRACDAEEKRRLRERPAPKGTKP